MPISAPYAVVTCGPAHEPIDAVRRITNLSSGELGTLLCEALAANGFEVLCLRGEMASFRPPKNVETVNFTTNASVLDAFLGLKQAPAAVFHAAALCDFTVASIDGAEPGKKIRSDTPELNLTLRPAVKVLPKLRAIFPKALIVGWKYELDGTKDDALERGRHQIKSAQTDACVVNGSAYGEGFGLLDGEAITHLASKSALCARLPEWAREKLTPP